MEQVIFMVSLNSVHWSAVPEGDKRLRKSEPGVFQNAEIRVY